MLAVDWVPSSIILLWANFTRLELLATQGRSSKRECWLGEHDVLLSCSRGLRVCKYSHQFFQVWACTSCPSLVRKLADMYVSATAPS